MNVQVQVQQIWRALSRCERKAIRAFAKGSLDAGLRCHCKIVLSLVQGNIPAAIAKSGLCSASQLYRVARRFLDDGLSGLADRQEDNGQPKVTEAYEAELLEAVGKSPRNFGYRRPTWT